MSRMGGGRARRGGWRWRAAGVLAAVVSGGSALPVRAHGVAGAGDTSHLAADLLMAFGLPLAVLLIGALVGVLLSTVLARRNADGEPAEPAALARPDSPPPADGPPAGR